MASPGKGQVSQRRFYARGSPRWQDRTRLAAREDHLLHGRHAIALRRPLLHQGELPEVKVPGGHGAHVSQVLDPASRESQV